MSSPVLEAVDLTRVLQSGGRPLTVLDHVSISVPQGEFLAVLGPSGSGKSTLLGLLAGLDRPTEGEIRFQGEAIQDWSEDRLARWRRDNVGFVFQSFQLLGHLTARENVLIPLELRGAADPGGRAAALLELVGLGARGHHYPSQLSGGEQQRVALARGFAAEPALLLADEPTGNLDSGTGTGVLTVMSDLQREKGTTLVLVTHDPAVAAYADRNIYLKDGRVDREERPARPAAGQGV